jgi:hypothetical protein
MLGLELTKNIRPTKEECRECQSENIEWHQIGTLHGYVYYICQDCGRQSAMWIFRDKAHIELDL